jgi:hypothetical protein
LPSAALFAQRFKDAIPVDLDIGNRGGLGADMTLAERIIAISANLAHRASFQLDAKATNRFAQHAGMQSSPCLIVACHDPSVRWTKRLIALGICHL